VHPLGKQAGSSRACESAVTEEGNRKEGALAHVPQAHPPASAHPVLLPQVPQCPALLPACPVPGHERLWLESSQGALTREKERNRGLLGKVRQLISIKESVCGERAVTGTVRFRRTCLPGAVAQKDGEAPGWLHSSHSVSGCCGVG